jgi:hypothetical protein
VATWSCGRMQSNALTAHMKRACQVFAVPAPGLWLFSNGCPGLRGAGAGVLVCARALIAARSARAATPLAPWTRAAAGR